MAYFLKSVHFLLVAFVSWKHLVLSQEPNQFTYHGFTEVNLSLNRVARVHPDGLLELTNKSKQEVGHNFFPFPFKFNTSALNSTLSQSFSTYFVFAIVPKSPTLSGHGISFTTSPSANFTGATATQYLGLFNRLSSNHVFAVELGTVQNLEFIDINDNHAGVDVNSLTSIQSAPVAYLSEISGKFEELKLKSGKPFQVWIDYDEADKLLNVKLAPIRSQKPKRALLSTIIDLSAK